MVILPPKEENIPPECRAGGQDAVWNPPTDMWQFGRVLDEWKVEGSHAKALRASLLLENPNDRPTAVQALQHEWFQNHN